MAATQIPEENTIMETDDRTVFVASFPDLDDGKDPLSLAIDEIIPPEGQKWEDMEKLLDEDEPQSLTKINSDIPKIPEQNSSENTQQPHTSHKKNTTPKTNEENIHATSQSTKHRACKGKKQQEVMDTDDSEWEDKKDKKEKSKKKQRQTRPKTKSATKQTYKPSRAAKPKSSSPKKRSRRDSSSSSSSGSSASSYSSCSEDLIVQTVKHIHLMMQQKKKARKEEKKRVSENKKSSKDNKSWKVVDSAPLLKTITSADDSEKGEPAKEPKKKEEKRNEQNQSNIEVQHSKAKPERNEKGNTTKTDVEKPKKNPEIVELDDSPIIKNEPEDELELVEKQKILANTPVVKQPGTSTSASSTQGMIKPTAASSTQGMKPTAATPPTPYTVTYRQQPGTFPIQRGIERENYEGHRQQPGTFPIQRGMDREDYEGHDDYIYNPNRMEASYPETRYHPHEYYSPPQHPHQSTSYDPTQRRDSPQTRDYHSAQQQSLQHSPMQSYASVASPKHDDYQVVNRTRIAKKRCGPSGSRALMWQIIEAKGDHRDKLVEEFKTMMMAALPKFFRDSLNKKKTLQHRVCSNNLDRKCKNAANPYCTSYTGYKYFHACYVCKLIHKQIDDTHLTMDCLLLD